MDLITIGSAFHCLDQARVTQQALVWLKPTGCIATLGTEDILAERSPLDASL